MEWNWLCSLVYGLISGVSEFFPVSSQAHQWMFAQLTGVGSAHLPFRLFGHIGGLLALLLACKPQWDKLRREKRIASLLSKRRKRQPDIKSLLELRFLRMAGWLLVLSFPVYFFFSNFGERPWLVALLLLLNGVILYLPQFFPSGNKEALSLSAADGLLTGFAGAFGRLSGISGIGCTMSAMKMRGVDWQYALQLCLLLGIPALLIALGCDVYGMVFMAESLALGHIFNYLLTALSAFAGAYFGIVVMRFLSVKAGFSGFAYYCWGMALFTFLLYLAI